MGNYKRFRKRRQLVKNSSGRIVGEIVNGCLVKDVRASVHMLRDPQGFAWDIAILEQAENAGVKRIIIIDTETDKVYSSSLQDFRRYGVHVDRGYGAQLCLPLKYWQQSQ